VQAGEVANADGVRPWEELFDHSPVRVAKSDIEAVVRPDRGDQKLAVGAGSADEERDCDERYGHDRSNPAHALPQDRQREIIWSTL
jgi:hypothetical protein